MTTVLLDGPGAGMTTEDYEAMRKLDCKVAAAMGYKSLDASGILWDTNGSPDGAYRDEKDGVPFYSKEIASAYEVLRWALQRWRYAGRQLFFARLQKRAGFGDEGDMPSWPDVLTSLVSELPEHICQAFVSTVTWAKLAEFPLEDASAQAQDFADKQVVTQLIEEVDEDGNKTVKAGIKAINGTPPWVH